MGSIFEDIDLANKSEVITNKKNGFTDDVCKKGEHYRLFLMTSSVDDKYWVGSPVIHVNSII